MDVLKYVYPQATRSAQKMSFFFQVLNDEISKVSILRELHIILNWLTFQNDQKTHLSISV